MFYYFLTPILDQVLKNALCNLRSSQSILSIKNIKADKNGLANLNPPDESLSVVFENLHKLKIRRKLTYGNKKNRFNGHFSKKSMISLMVFNLLS